MKERFLKILLSLNDEKMIDKFIIDNGMMLGYLLKNKVSDNEELIIAIFKDYNDDLNIVANEYGYFTEMIYEKDKEVVCSMIKWFQPSFLKGKIDSYEDEIIYDEKYIKELDSIMSKIENKANSNDNKTNENKKYERMFDLFDNL